MMTKDEIIVQAERIKSSIKSNRTKGKTEAMEFLKIYGGVDNSFYRRINSVTGYNDNAYKDALCSVMDSFIDFVRNGLLRAVSLEREIQIETVSDFLEQAEKLLNDKIVHPAAPAVIIGAALEEFLRNWLEEIGTDLSEIKNSLDVYSIELRRKELITKQDQKDITSWGGIRNDAAHGHWENVDDRNRIRLMLEGVNLFMRKYGL